jgi:sigma-E factor negative regulatory protein RseB
MGRRVSNLVAGVLLGCCASFPVIAGPSACLDWLKAVSFAGLQTDYSGVFVYQYSDNVESSRIMHVIDAGVEYEKLESLDGPKREILRHHGHVWVSTERGIIETASSQQGRGQFPALLPQQLSALCENYRVQQLGVERVAGHEARVILLQPKDGGLYSHKIWLQPDSGLLLKAAVLDEKGKAVEQYAFTQLDIGGKIDRAWLASNSAVNYAKKSSREIEDEVIPFVSGWVVDFLPAGFKKIKEVKRPMHGKHAPVTQIVFSDGLGAVSVFVEPDDKDEDDVDGLSSRGAMSLYHKVVGKNLFTVVGEVPPRTVAKMLDSIRYNGKQ